MNKEEIKKIMIVYNDGSKRLCNNDLEAQEYRNDEMYLTEVAASLFCSTPPPSEASRGNTIEAAKRFINSEDIKTLGLARSMVLYASQFPTANVTQGEVERIKEARSKEDVIKDVFGRDTHINKFDLITTPMHNLFVCMDSYANQLRTTIEDQSKEIERLKEMNDTLHCQLKNS